MLYLLAAAELLAVRWQLEPYLRPCLRICTTMYFEIIGEITDIETIAVGSAIRDITRLRKRYGGGRWRKLKGIATVRLSSGKIRLAEVHWYEAHGIGKKRFKIKRFLD